MSFKNIEDFIDLHESGLTCLEEFCKFLQKITLKKGLKGEKCQLPSFCILLTHTRCLFYRIDYEL